MQWLILFLVLGFGILILFFATSNLISIILGAPAVKSDRDVAQAVYELTKIKNQENFYELGSGFAFISKFMADRGAKSFGIEASPFYAWLSSFLFRHRADVKIMQQNIFNTNLNKADVVYCYLLQNAMTKLELKFATDLKPGARVVSQSFKLPNKPPTKILKTTNGSTLYLYNY